MKFLSAALVVISGVTLWAVGAVAATWVSSVAGNRNAAETATYGGMAIVVFGGWLLLLAHRDN